MTLHYNKNELRAYKTAESFPMLVKGSSFSL